MKYGLKKNVLDAIQQVFASYAGIQRAILYGSRAKGNHKLGSDIDLTLVAPTLKLEDLLKIENKLDDFLLPYKIDISLYHQIENKDLLDHITRVGVLFYQR